MRLAPAIMLALFGVAASSVPASVIAQAAPGSVVMRSQNVITWWVVDPSTGLTAFYGGDIIAICNDNPDGYDLLDFQEAHAPNDIATNLVAKGKGIGASLWDHAPPFRMPALCQDILSRGAPKATGTADLTITGRFPVTWADPTVVSPFGMTARATMHTPDGQVIRVSSQYRCVSRGADMQCTQSVQAQ
jgi:hypothetical protein